MGYGVGDQDKFEFYKDQRGKWRWRITARNGHIISASSQGYKTKWGAKRNARRLGQKV